MVTHSNVLAWRVPWTRSLKGCSPEGREESDTAEATERALQHQCGAARVPCASAAALSAFSAWGSVLREPLACSALRSAPLSSGGHLFVLCVCESAAVLLCVLNCLIF